MLSEAREVLGGSWATGWEPDPELTVCEWADKNIVLSSKGSAEPGRFKSSRTPYVREILENLSPSSPTKRVVWIAAAQIAKTQTGLNWVGAVMDMWPGPMLLVEPSLDIAKKLSKQRIAPMIDSTEVLRKRIVTKSKDTSNTLFEKEFPGGTLMLTGANSAAGLRSMPIRYLFLDEVDAYPGDVEGEGSPIDLAEKRTTTFARRKILLTSTPTIKGYSAIEREYLRSDQRKYFVPCPHCGDYHTLEWGNVRWDDGAPDTVRLVCPGCGAFYTEASKTEMLARGEWRATAVSADGTVGYHLNGLYSPRGWKSWEDCVREFVEAKNDTEKLKVWVNTVLAETWEERGDGIEPNALRARAEPLVAEVVPRGGAILTASVDVQADRLEVKVKAWGRLEESWLVYYDQIYGNPLEQEVWDQLDEVLLSSFKCEGGGTMQIDTTLVDSGFSADAVYRFCKPRLRRRVYPLKGELRQGKPIIGVPSRNNAYRVPLYLISTDTAKSMVVSRLKIKHEGPGYIHIPEWVDDEYLAQLTAERPVRKYIRGKGTTRVWISVRARNEAFDLEVYCLAALYTRGFRYLQKLLGGTSAPKALEPVEESDATTEAEMTPRSADALVQRQDAKPAVEALVAEAAKKIRPAKSKWGSRA